MLLVFLASLGSKREKQGCFQPWEWGVLRESLPCISWEVLKHPYQRRKGEE